MYPTLFTLGKWAVPTYTVLLDLGLILGLVVTFLEGGRLAGSDSRPGGSQAATALDLGLWAVIGGILGGRVGYVVANWRVFAEDWSRVWRIWEGGLSFHGAYLGGLLAVVVFAWVWWQRTRGDADGRRLAEAGFLSFALAVGDLLTLGLALGLVFGWAACLMGGSAYGRVGDGLGYALLPDLYGVTAPRFATQAVGLVFSALLFIGFWLLRRRWPFPGAAFLMFNLLYFAGQFFLGFTRGDEAIYVGPWRLAQLLDLALVLASAVALLLLWWRWRAHGEIAGEPEGEDTSSLPAEA